MVAAFRASGYAIVCLLFVQHDKPKVVAIMAMNSLFVFIVNLVLDYVAKVQKSLYIGIGFVSFFDVFFGGGNCSGLCRHTFEEGCLIVGLCFVYPSYMFRISFVYPSCIFR